MGDTANETEPAKMIENKPPQWRATLSGALDLGFPDYIPARPGHNQPEDRVTETNVKLGYSGGNAVAGTTESVSVHNPISQRLRLPTMMDNLSNLADEISAVRAQAVPPIPAWSYKLPNRVVYNEHMRQAFVADLANPNFPIHRLAKNVPHGFKGQDLLEMLYGKDVPVDRAAWFIQVLGAHEVQAIRSRAGSSNSSISPPDQYSIEFTTVCCAFLRKQLVEITLPQRQPIALMKNQANQSTMRSGGAAITVRPPQQFKSVLADEGTKARWLKKWEYSLDLIKCLMSRNLLDGRTFSSWLADQVGISNLAQLGFAASLMDQFLFLVWNSIAVARTAVRACVDQLAQIQAHKLRHTLKGVEHLLIRIIQMSYDWSDDVLVCPASWLWHEDLLRDVIAQRSEASSSDEEKTKNIKRRNDAMLLRDSQVTSTGWSANRQSMATIQILDSVNSTSKLSDVYAAFFGKVGDDKKSMEEARSKIHMLLNWSTGFAHLGMHRPYLCSSLLQTFKEEKVSTSNIKGRKSWLEDVIFEWLDGAAAAFNEHKYDAIGITIGDLTRVGLFSLGDYLRRQLARGIMDKSAAERLGVNKLRQLLRYLPCFASSLALTMQRKLVLFGDADAPDDQEEEVKAIKREIGAYLAVAGLDTGYPATNLTSSEDEHDLPITKGSSRYVQVQMRMWLLPLVLKMVSSSNGKYEKANELLARAIHVLEVAKGMATIHQILLRALPTASLAILDEIIYATMRHLDSWAAMDCLDSLAGAIFDRFCSFAHGDERPKHQHPMAWELARKATLSDTHADVLRRWLTRDQHPPLQRYVSQETVPSVLHTVQQIHRETDPVKVEKVGRDLWQRFDHDPDFPGVIWRNALDSLQAVRAAGLEKDSRHRALMSINTLLTVVADLRANGLRPPIYIWCEEQAKAGYPELASSPGDPVTDLLLLMLQNRSVSTKSIFHHLFQPIWRHLSKSRSLLAGTPTQRDVNLLLSSLKFARYAFSLKTSERVIYGAGELRTAQCFKANAAAIFEDHQAMQDFIQHLSFLPVFEVALQDLPMVSAEVAAFREGVSALATFKKGAFRHLDVLKDAFLTRQVRLTNESQLDAALVDALLLIMTESDEADSASPSSYDWTDERAELSPWQWKRTVLELRLSFKRLSMRLRPGEAVESTDNSIDDFVASLLDRPLTQDQMALVDEAMKGIDVAAVNALLKAGAKRLAAQLLSIIDSDDQERRTVVSQIRTVSTILALALNHSRRAGFHTRASSGGIADPSSYISSLCLLVGHLGKCDAQSQKSSDILETSFLTLRLYLAMVGDSPEMAAVSPQMTVGLLTTTNDLVKIASERREQWHEMCMDTFSYVLDELPKEKRITVYDKLCSLSEESVASSRPGAWLPKEVQELLPSRSSTWGSTTGRQNNVWELIPYYEPPTEKVSLLAGWNIHIQARNGGSLDLTTFNARLTGDRIQGVDGDSEESVFSDDVEFEQRPWELWVTERDIPAGRTGESLFARDWASGLVDDPGDKIRTSPGIYGPRNGTSTSAPAPAAVTTPIKGTSLADAINIDDEEEPTEKRKRESSPSDSNASKQHQRKESERPTAAKRPRVGSKSVARKAPTKTITRKASLKSGRRKSGT